jgi:hypothetical protein
MDGALEERSSAMMVVVSGGTRILLEPRRLPKKKS